MKKTPYSKNSYKSLYLFTEQDLQEALNFTDEDLQANRDGKLSEKQREKLEIAQQRSFRVLWVMTFIILASLLLALVSGTYGLIALGTIALLLAIMALMEYLTSYRAYQHDLNLKTIETAQGLLEYIMRENTSFDGMTHPAGIRIGELKFLLLQDQTTSFLEGEIYSIYYAPATQTLLSAEAVFISESEADDSAYWEEPLLDEMKQDDFIED